MRLSFLILLFIIASCKPAPVEEITRNISIDYTTMNLRSTEMTLIGKAQKEALKWDSFQDLITGIENYDHTIGSTNKLIDHVDKMLEEPVNKFEDQAIRSRIKVLKTRLHIYKSYLGYRIKTTDKLEKKYNDIIISLDELILHMNWKVNSYDGSNQQLLEDLKKDLDPEDY